MRAPSRGPPVLPALTASGTGTPATEPPDKVTQSTVVIWYQKTCEACKASESIFEGLRRYRSGTWAVHQVEVTEERRQRFPHVLMVPCYDVIVPDPASTSVYGPGTRLVTVLHNDFAQLQALLPGLERVTVR